jgi:malignant T-cell-amplified sequence
MNFVYLPFIFSSDRLMLYSLENEGIPLFFQHYDSVYVPTLKLLHKCIHLWNLFYSTIFFILIDPNMLPSVKVDTGAIKHIINGADVMAPGLTSPNAFIPNDLKADIFVVRICSFMYLIG